MNQKQAIYSITHSLNKLPNYLQKVKDKKIVKRKLNNFLINTAYYSINEFEEDAEITP